MKKITLVATVALCFAGNSFAQENAGGEAAPGSAFGDMNKEVIVAGAVGLGILGAMIANNRERSIVDPGPDPTCGDGEELVDGVCVPVQLPIAKAVYYGYLTHEMVARHLYVQLLSTTQHKKDRHLLIS